MIDIGFISYLAAGLAFAVLALVLYGSWRGRGAMLIIAVIVTAIWAVLLAIESMFAVLAAPVVWSIEIARMSIWLSLFHRLLGRSLTAAPGEGGLLKNIPYLVFGLPTILLIGVWGWYFLEPSEGIFHQSYPQSAALLLLTLLGLMFTELLYRNARSDQRWSIKYICLAVGGMFAYDFYLYSDALLFQRISPIIWQARGAVFVFFAPLIALFAARNSNWSDGVFISRRVVFHSVTLLGGGLYLLVMGAVGHYLNAYGGEWGPVIQIIFFVGAFLLLAVLLFSGQIRAHLRVFLSKHFFSYAYDYREQWRAITAALSRNDAGLRLEKRVIMAIAQLVESPGGLLWVREAGGDFIRKADFGMPATNIGDINASEPLIKFVESQGWVVNLSEMETVPELYEGLQRPEWLADCRTPWAFVPLFLGNDLYGLVLLARPRTTMEWNWEVIDLLKTAGIQAASYLALDDAARALAEARQFEGFNRLSAFVMHDLKNLTNQLSLVIKNAERHHGNPEFMKDTVKTIEHAVGKMNRLMSQLKSAGTTGTKQSIPISEMLDEVVQLRSKQRPAPTLVSAVQERAMVFADPDRLASSFEYVIQNAQEATGRHGTVQVKIHSDPGRALIDVEDDGDGMDADFIREHLFKPFETTKGLTGMGIGAYESREYIRSLGGDVKVTSTVGKGTRFQFIVPLIDQRAPHRPGRSGAMV